jgi:hypothetical protein
MRLALLRVPRATRFARDLRVHATRVARALGLFKSRDLLQHPTVHCARLVDLLTG